MKNSCIEKWGIEFVELLDKAVQNTKYMCPPMFKSLKEIASEMLNVDLPETSWYVLTNEDDQYGAASLLHKEFLAEIADEFQTDLYIIPDSVHRVLVHLGGSEVQVEEWKCTLKTLNTEMSDKDGILSYHIYKYDREEKELYIVS